MSNCFFFFNDTATTEIYTLSLHDALPICEEFLKDISRGYFIEDYEEDPTGYTNGSIEIQCLNATKTYTLRSEEHTSELQSRQYLVCRLLLEKKKNLSHRLHFCFQCPPAPT